MPNFSTGKLGTPLQLSKGVRPEIIRDRSGAPVAEAVSVDVALALIEYANERDGLRGELARQHALWSLQSEMIRALAAEVPDEVRTRIFAALGGPASEPHDQRDETFMSAARAALDAIYGVRRREYSEPALLKFPEGILPENEMRLWGLRIFVDPELSPGTARIKSREGWAEFRLPT